MSLPKPAPGILDISPYVGGRAKAPGAARVFKLSANESPFGPSPRAIEAYKDSLDKLGLYPEGSSAVLREAIAEVMGLNVDRIVCGTGSDEILHLLPAAYAGPGDEVIYSEHGFLVYRIATLAAGATPVVAPERDLTTDVDAILSRVTSRTKLVFIANPNNPTGSYLPASELRRLRQGLPEHCLLVLDAAYCEYVSRNDYETGLELVATTSNTIMTRTFSKIHGLAALRVGWAYAPAEIIDVLNRVRAPFNVGIPGQYAAAAAIRDRAHVEMSAAHNLKWLGWLRDQISALGLKVHPSVANFLLIEFPKDGPHTAVKADAFLMARGFILRHVAAYGLPQCLRLTVGTEEANRLVAAAIAEFMRTK